MIPTTLIKASQLKAESHIPMVIQPRQQGWVLVSRYNTLTAQQKAALWALSCEVNRLRGDIRAFYAVSPAFFEHAGIASKSGGLALARQLTQLKLLRCYVGKFSLTTAAINLIESVANEISEH